MFNSFYESLPPIELGKSKILSLAGAYSLYIISFLGMLGTSITHMILSPASAYGYMFLIFTLLFLAYSFGKTMAIAAKVLYPSYESKTYKVTFSNMQMLRRGLLFQASFTGVTILYTLISGISGTSGLDIIAIVMICAMAFFMLVSAGMYTTYSSIIKPFLLKIRQTFMEQKSNAQGTPTGGSTPKGGPRTWDAPGTTSGFKPPEEEVPMTKEQEEEIARGANVPIIDISDDLEDKNIKTTTTPEDDSDDDDDSSDKKITAF